MAMTNVNGKWIWKETFEEKVNRAASQLEQDILATKRELGISTQPNPIYELIRIALLPEPKVAPVKNFTAAQFAKLGYKTPRSPKLSNEEIEDMGGGFHSVNGFNKF